MQTATCLRIYLSEGDCINHVPAAEAILQLCRAAGLSAVSVMRGMEGLGAHGVHSTSLLSLSSNLPLVVEVIAEDTKIQAAIQQLQPLIPQATIATWQVQWIQQGSMHETTD